MSAIQQMLAAPGASGFAPTITSFVNAGRNTSTTINYPTAPQAGDLAVLLSFSYSGAGGAPAGVLATGFTNIVNTNLSSTQSGRMRCMYRLCDGSEGASASSLMQGGSDDDDLLYIFRANVPIASVVAAGTLGSLVYQDTPTARTIAGASTTGSAVISMAFGVDTGPAGSIIADMGFSPSPTSSNNADNGYAGAKWRYELAASAQNTSSDITGTEANLMGLQSFYLSLTS